MAAITAAVIAGVGTAATVGTQAYQASQTPTGPGKNPTISKLPQDPLSKAMRDYYARLMMTNQGVQPPTFQSVIESGGDMSKAQMPITQPGMTPQEASTFGFTGPHGEPVPYVSPTQAQASQQPGPGGAPPPGMTLTPEQNFFMAQERARQSRMAGQEPGPWASKILQTNQRANMIANRIAALQGRAGDTPTQQQQNRLGRLQDRQQRVLGRQSQELGGALPGPRGDTMQQEQR